MYLTYSWEKKSVSKPSFSFNKGEQWLCFLRNHIYLKIPASQATLHLAIQSK